MQGLLRYKIITSLLCLLGIFRNSHVSGWAYCVLWLSSQLSGQNIIILNIQGEGFKLKYSLLNLHIQDMCSHGLLDTRQNHQQKHSQGLSFKVRLSLTNSASAFTWYHSSPLQIFLDDYFASLMISIWFNSVADSHNAWPVNDSWCSISG